VYRVEIPNWLPARANEFIGRHWAAKYKLRKADDEVVAAYCLAAGVPPAAGQRRVSLEITLGPRMRCDADCFWKSTLDALVACGALVDDDSKYCVLGPVNIDRDYEMATVIELEDL
jgi:hypothetical protein